MSNSQRSQKQAARQSRQAAQSRTAATPATPSSAPSTSSTTVASASKAPDRPVPNAWGIPAITARIAKSEQAAPATVASPPTVGSSLRAAAAEFSPNMASVVKGDANSRVSSAGRSAASSDAAGELLRGDQTDTTNLTHNSSPFSVGREFVPGAAALPTASDATVAAGLDALHIAAGADGDDTDPAAVAGGYYPVGVSLHPQQAADPDGFIVPHLSQHIYKTGPITLMRHHLYAPTVPHATAMRPNQRAIHSFFMPEELRQQLAERSAVTQQTMDPDAPATSHSHHHTHAHSSGLGAGAGGVGGGVGSAALSSTLGAAASGNRSPHPVLPAEVNRFHSLYPLEESGVTAGTVSQLFGYATHVYKAISAVDGGVYILRRLEGFKLLNDASMTVLDYWNRIAHPNIVSLREAFTTKAFNDDSLIFVYDYHPLAETVLDRHFERARHPHAAAPLTPGQMSMMSSGATPVPATVQPGMSLANSTVFISSSPPKKPPPKPLQPITEALLWSYIVQIVSALKVIHASGLACRTLEPTKLLVSGRNRLRVNCVGIFDVISFSQNVARYQQEDLLQFGQLILRLACNDLQPMRDLPAALDHVGRTYSKDMKATLWYLLGQPTHMKSVDELMAMIAPRILFELGAAFQYQDALEDSLTRELENGRLVRLLCKLGFINERPEFDMDPNWSETGDRYLLKLLRDYIFHQVDATGRPIVDLGHVLRCLNKLDAGSAERIMLTSRDEQSCLVVSYKDLKQCIDATFSQFLLPKQKK